MPARATFRQLKGPASPFAFGQEVFLRHESIIKHDLSGDRGAQRKLAFDLRASRIPCVPRSIRKPRMTSSSLAQTSATSATGELVIHILLPVSR